MDFTREPIIETIITPREGYRLVIRSSKNIGQEEHFVDAIEVVSFGKAFFFRSLEKPKPFLVPVSDYEILEMREPRMVLKMQPSEGSVKIGGGREATGRGAYREEREKHPVQHAREEVREEAYAQEGRSQASFEGRGKDAAIVVALCVEDEEAVKVQRVKE